MSLKSNTIFFVYSFSNEFQLFRTIGIGFGWRAIDWFEFCVRKWLVVEQWAGKPAAGVLTNHESSYVSGFPHWQMNVKKIMPALPGNIKMFKKWRKVPPKSIPEQSPPDPKHPPPYVEGMWPGMVWEGGACWSSPLSWPAGSGMDFGGAQLLLFYIFLLPGNSTDKW